jgi:hypothetical protein
MRKQLEERGELLATVQVCVTEGALDSWPRDGNLEGEGVGALE